MEISGLGFYGVGVGVEAGRFRVAVGNSVAVGDAVARRLGGCR